MPSFLVVLVCALTAVGKAALTWKFADDRAALCNDFTRAGFFHQTPSGEVKKWVIFLDSGSLCQSNETCNRRYFNSDIMERYNRDGAPVNGLSYGNFDTALAWAETGAAGQPLTQVVNPLMTSSYCFRNETHFFSDSDGLSVEGRDILSSACRENPTFCNHGHVLVPYCSSDLWLGRDDKVNQTCDCWDQDCFTYNPTSEDLQFTFRGQTIFRSVLETLDRLYNLKTASEIVLVGSSAGGVGVLNSAKWVRENFQNVSLKVITDSSWFINFRDSIVQEFTSGSVNTNFLALSSAEACFDIRLGYPCCVFAQCLLVGSSTTTREPYFPRDTPLFVLTSLYDIFIFSIALSGLDAVNPAGLALDFVTTIGEYGGVMNETLIETPIVSNVQFSFFATQCFQHVYFAGSTLRGEGALFGGGAVDFKFQVAEFKHRILPGTWDDHVLGYYDGEGYTIRDAINYWYLNVSHTGVGVAFRDQCSGPHCSNSCPEEIILQVGSTAANAWSRGARITIALIVLLISTVCIIMKLYCVLWLKKLKWKQQRFVRDSESPLERKFPSCTDEEAISVACLDLHYHVTVHEGLKRRSQEKKETDQPVVLEDLQNQGYGEETVSDLDASHKVLVDGQFKFSKLRSILGTKKRNILNGVSVYFNPGELNAIMGASGSGKTTLLDILTGRRSTDNVTGNVFVNGLPVEENQNWYISNTGYVLQLAAPYYEELTVRENLTLTAWVKLHISSREKFQRVEQVMEVTGLMDLADTVVGGATGPGLSGGQKRRLAVALQLLKLPSVIFLDEPTSGLDATSAIEFLTHLNTLADSNRTVVLTIHQPRLEIFHMFHKVTILSEGKVAYHGVPEVAYKVFVSALRSTFPSVDSQSLEDHNPADLIMDMLGDRSMRKIVTRFYDDSGEPELVRRALTEAWVKEQGHSDTDVSSNAVLTKLHQWGGILCGTRHAGRTQNYAFERLAAHEARELRRESLSSNLYLPLIYLGFTLVLGTVYYQTKHPILVISAFGLFSFANSLFLYPVLFNLYYKAGQIYKFEHADGAGRASDLVIQPAVRFLFLGFITILPSAGVLYLLLVDIRQWNFVQFSELAVTNFALNQTWVALVICFFLTFKDNTRFYTLLSAVMGFFSGFIIPINKIPPWYRWIIFINPNYYGLSAVSVILLSDYESECERNGGSEFECYPSSGDYVLTTYDFGDTNPYFNIVVLLIMATFFLVMAGVSNWVWHIQPYRVKKQITHTVKKILKKNKQPQEVSEQTSKTESYLSQKRQTLVKKGSSYLDDQPHTVWKPEHKTSQEKLGLQERRDRLNDRVWATRQVLREQREEIQRSNSTPMTRGPQSKPAGNVTAECSGESVTKALASSLPVHPMALQFAKLEEKDEESVPNWAKSKTPSSKLQWIDSSPKLKSQGFHGSPKPFSPLLVRTTEPIPEENMTESP